MRPVRKKKPGETVSYRNSRNELVEETVRERYSPYGKAKMPLLGNLGWYCSYCEGYRCLMNFQLNMLNPREQTVTRRHGITSFCAAECAILLRDIPRRMPQNTIGRT